MRTFFIVAPVGTCWHMIKNARQGLLAVRIAFIAFFVIDNTFSLEYKDSCLESEHAFRRKLNAVKPNITSRIIGVFRYAGTWR